MRKCCRCKIFKDSTLFSKGQKYCKACIKIRRLPNRERLMLYNREWRKNNKSKLYRAVKDWISKNKERYREIQNTSQMKYQRKNPHKMQTRYVTKSLVKKGILTRMACEKCGNFLSEIHHLDYSDPYTIWWLCRKHHRMADRGELELYLEQK